jgi:hypothetical protein
MILAVNAIMIVTMRVATMRVPAIMLVIQMSAHVIKMILVVSVLKHVMFFIMTVSGVVIMEMIVALRHVIMQKKHVIRVVMQMIAVPLNVYKTALGLRI